MNTFFSFGGCICSPNYFTDNVIACEDYTWNGSTYINSGTYGWTGTNIAGCDSIVTLNLIINQPDGCTDSSAFNYNPNAICDDGSCIAVLLGCMDSTALNYNMSANTS